MSVTRTQSCYNTIAHNRDCHSIWAIWRWWYWSVNISHACACKYVETNILLIYFVFSSFPPQVTCQISWWWATRTSLPVCWSCGLESCLSRCSPMSCTIVSLLLLVCVIMLIHMVFLLLLYMWHMSFTIVSLLLIICVITLLGRYTYTWSFYYFYICDIWAVRLFHCCWWYVHVVSRWYFSAYTTLPSCDFIPLVGL